MSFSRPRSRNKFTG